MDYKYSDITEKIIKACMVVHNTLGNGFQELIYQRALSIELSEMQIPFQRELSMPIFYRNQQIGERRVDFLVVEKISVEIKALIKLENVHLAQAMNILKRTI
jgi:GxxExxY protein